MSKWRILAFFFDEIAEVWRWFRWQRLSVTVSDTATSTCTLSESGWTCTLTDAAVR